MIALLFFLAVIYFRNRKVINCATEIRNDDYLNQWLIEHKHLRSITIKQSDRVKSPLAVGILNPQIILPKSMNLDDKLLMNYVLTHEYCHIKRYDAVWKLFLLLALCIHWFNPMVWLMFVLSSRDLELTCDEAVIYRFGAETKKDYAYMLIGMAEQRTKFATLFNGFSKNATQERIISIMKIKKPSILAISIAVLLIAGATTILATTAKGQGNEVAPEAHMLLGGGRIESETNSEGSYISMSTGFVANPAEVRNGQIYFVLDGSDKTITSYCSGKTYYQYERIADNGYRHVVLVGGTPDNIGWAEFVWNDNSEYVGSNATYNSESAPEWLVLARETLIG